MCKVVRDTGQMVSLKPPRPHMSDDLTKMSDDLDRVYQKII